MPRHLRIAASVFFGMLTLALCVLWVRSYIVSTEITMFDGVYNELGIGSGMIGARRLHSVAPLFLGHFPLTLRQFEGTNYYQTRLIFVDCDEFDFVFPIWIPTILSAIGIGLPWTRFSLRTLLLATTLVAVVLGLVAWIAR